MYDEKNRGDYQTRGYFLVKEELKHAQGAHLSAEEIYSALQEKGEKVGRTTVYRQLERLLKEGKARRTHADGGAFFCFAEGECHEHYHLLCTDCGKLKHLSCDKVKQLFHHILDEHGFAIDPSQTTLYGICADCAPTSEKRKKESAHAASTHT